jgi:hypothetical protein
MGLQKYRADKKGETQSNGAIPYYTNWIGGPSLALIKNCPIKNTVIDTGVSARTVYVRGEPDTFFSQPAACKYKGKTIHGYITGDDNNELEFRCYKDQGI